MADTTRITNLTDVPGPFKLVPHHIDLFNQNIEPGEGMAIPSHMVDKKLQLMAEKTGKIAIGPLPAYYTDAKAVKGRTLTQEEAIKRLQTSGRPAEVETSEVPPGEATTESVKARARRRE